MIDQKRLDKISLHSVPLGQKFVATVFLIPNYNWPGKRTEIVLEGAENIPREGGVIFVMNHTDRYNYWPFQYKLWREKIGFTATWVKGKYYENPGIAFFMDSCNNIPVPSKGYVLAKDFALSMERKPTDEEYSVLKALADGKTTLPEVEKKAPEGLRSFLHDERWGGNYPASLEKRFNGMMQSVVDINIDGLKKGLNLLIFPQGTRSKRLTRGHVGAAQMILHTGAPVIPVGCNGSDKVYPGNSPWASGGRIVYRIGKPLSPDKELAKFKTDGPFVPFTKGAEQYTEDFRKLTDFLMDRINDLLDPEYQYGEADLESGADRFL